jgi:hypothetical protein
VVAEEKLVKCGHAPILERPDQLDVPRFGLEFRDTLRQ